MKRISLFLIALAACIAVSAADRAAQIREKLFARDQSSVIVVAHRGDWRYAPENSVAAIEHSIQMGVDVVEIDLQLTKDSVLILMHDEKLDRTTSGKGKIAEWTLDSIRSLTLRNGCGIRTKHKVPTLEEALLAAKGKVMLNLDKADRYFDLVMPLLQKTGTTGQIIMKGSKPPHEVQQFYGKYLKDVIYMPIVNLDKEDAAKQIDNFVKTINPVAFELLFVADSNPLPKQLKTQLKGKALIWYNTLWDTMAGGHDDDKSLEDIDGGYGYLIDTLGCRIIQTDRAELLLNYLKQRKLHD
ncbi:glycerophosphoryl diester phosphodiesterase [Bacteroidia bacterium]|nr:glycerophosphoryl diester phosphodiesterase [Bacteroidia bacterium]